VVIGKSPKHAPQPHLVEDDRMAEARSSDRIDEALDLSVFLAATGCPVDPAACAGRIVLKGGMKRLLFPLRWFQGLRRASGGLAMVLCLALSLAACASRPFVVSPPPAATASLGIDVEARKARGPHDYDPDPRPISLCFSSQLNTQEEVVERARELCPNDGAIRYFGQDALFNDCALFQPNRITFICSPGPPPPSRFN